MCFFQHLQHSQLLYYFQINHAETSLLLTVQYAQKEYNSLTDQIIRAKYKQLDSHQFGAVGTPAFNAETCELANLLTCMSQFCQKLNLPPPKELDRPTFFKDWRCLLDLNYIRQAV